MLLFFSQVLHSICRMSCWPLRAYKLPTDFLSVSMAYANWILGTKSPSISWLLFFPSSSIGPPSMPMRWGVALPMKSLEFPGDRVLLLFFVLKCHEQVCRNVLLVVWTERHRWKAQRLCRTSGSLATFSCAVRNFPYFVFPRPFCVLPKFWWGKADQTSDNGSMHLPKKALLPTVLLGQFTRTVLGRRQPLHPCSSVLRMWSPKMIHVFQVLSSDWQWERSWSFNHVLVSGPIARFTKWPSFRSAWHWKFLASTRKKFVRMGRQGHSETSHESMRSFIVWDPIPASWKAMVLLCPPLEFPHCFWSLLLAVWMRGSRTCMTHHL